MGIAKDMKWTAGILSKPMGAGLAQGGGMLAMNTAHATQALVRWIRGGIIWRSLRFPIGYPIKPTPWPSEDLAVANMAGRS